MLTCAICNNHPATCFGSYEADNLIDVACDNCCGHGNEDGWCEPIEKIVLFLRAAMSKIWKET